MNNNFFKKMLLYMSAALIITSTPVSVLASEETTQVIEVNESAPGSDITPMQATVYAATKSGLNVRSGPSTSHSKIGKLEYGQAIAVTGITADNWYQIQYSGGIGYVLAKYVSDTPIENTGAATSGDITPDAAAAPDAAPSDIGNETPNPENIPETDTVTDSETNAQFDDEIGQLVGTPVIIVLAIAIFGVIALIGFSVYSMFKKEAPYSDDEYYEDEYYENGQYSDDEYYENEYYEDDSYESGQYSDDEYYEDEYYENGQYSDDEYYNDDDFQK